MKMVFNEYVKIREEKFGAVVFETLKEKVFVANNTGKDILHLIEEGWPLEKIIDTLADIYNAQPEDIRNDVVSFIDLLKDNTLITQCTQ